MATIGPIDKSGPSTRFQLDVSTSQNQAGNYSTVTITIKCWNGPSGTTGSYYGGAGTQSGSIDGVATVVTKSQTPFLPSGYAANQLRWSVTGSRNINHDSNGNLSNKVIRMSLDYGSIDESHTVTISFPRIPKAPAQVTGVTISSVLTNGFTVGWTAPNNNGSSITGYDIQYATNSGFTGATTLTDTASPLAITGLTPGTTYYVRVRAKNAVGAGPYSATVTQLTLPATPPTLTIASSASGTSATLTFAPPSGATGVTKYTWERRVTGTTTPVSTGDSTTVTTTVTGLSPGISYDWRASAWFGTYQSPWSTWTAKVQPKPNTSPGDYFDGNTADTDDLNFQWGATGTGAANADISIATAQVPIGWEAQYVGGAGVMYRITAGEFGDFSAHVSITRDCTGPGSRFGQQAASPFWSQVTEGATWIGSIYVNPSRSQRLAAEVTWMGSSGSVISRTVGPDVSVPGQAWFRLTAGDVAPVGATWAVVKVIDVSGTGWSVWLGGDSIDLDGAMVSLNELFDYFDGDTGSDGEFVYAWTGTANASTSTRTPVQASSPGTFSDSGGGVLVDPSGLLGSTPFAIIDPDCNPVVAPPRPPTIPSDCIDTTGVWRRIYVPVPFERVSDWLDTIPTLELTSGSVAARQVRIRWYPNPEGLAPGDLNTSKWMSEQIVSYMPAKTVMTIDGITQRVFAEVNGTATQNADHLLYGTGGKPPTWPVLQCGIAYVVSLEVPVDSPTGNVTGEIFVTQRT